MNTLSTINNDIKILYNNKMENYESKDINYMCRMIKLSFEYQKFIIFCKHILKLNKCIITNAYHKVLNLHHAPLTIYEIVETIVNKSLKKDKYFIYNKTIKEVLLLHYRLYIGLVPLDPDIHKIIHNVHNSNADIGKIPIVKIFFYWEEFIKNNREFLSKQTLKNILKYKKDDSTINFIDLFIKKPIYNNNDKIIDDIEKIIDENQINM